MDHEGLIHIIPPNRGRPLCDAYTVMSTMFTEPFPTCIVCWSVYMHIERITDFVGNIF